GSGSFVPTLVVDETDLSTNASAGFAGQFNGSYGADGPGTTSYGLSISADGAISGVVDTATGQNIVLHMNGGVVEGHVGTTGGALAFTISVDSGTGVVTLDQIRAVVHPTLDPNEPVSLTSNVVSLTATIVDNDGDSASVPLDIGGSMVFLDDGPSI